MKKPSLLIPLLAAIALFAQPVFAEDAHSHGTTAPAAQGETAKPAEKANDHESMMREAMEKMHAQMAAINQAKDPKKRLKLLQEHSKSMRDSIKMMHEMMGGMAMGCPMMGCPMMGGAMKEGCMMGGGMKGGCMMGGGMKGGCMMGGGMKEGCMMGGAMKEGCMMGGGMKGDCPMMGGGMKGECMMGGKPAGQAGDKASTAPAAQTTPEKIAPADKAAKKEGGKLWTCPMHPDVVRDQPGLCPICGMDLVEMDPSGATPSGHSHMMGGCMMGGGMKGGGMMDSGMMGQMMGMTGLHMDMMLMLMEQMIEHNEAAMAVRK